MSELTEKELMCITDSLSEEELLVKKYKMLASHIDDAEIKSAYDEISNKHQKHFDELYKLLG